MEASLGFGTLTRTYRLHGAQVILPKVDLASYRGRRRIVSSGLAARHDEAGLVGGHHGLRPIADVQLHQDVPDVSLDGRLADREVPRDLGIREPARDQAQNTLSRSVRSPSPERAIRIAAHPRELLDQAACHRGCQQCLAGGDHPHRGGKLLGRRILEQEATCPRP